MKQLGMVARSGRLLLASTLICLACTCSTQDDEWFCEAYAVSAVFVQVVGDEPIVAVTAAHGGSSAFCTASYRPGEAPDAAADIGFICTELGSPSSEKYTINVHGIDQRWTGSVEVKGDRCHVTEQKTLTIDLSSKPAGRSEYAVCEDGTGGERCCHDTPPEGACSADGLPCDARCDFSSPDAKIGTRTVGWSCVAGKWTGGRGEERCIRDGVRKDDPDLQSINR